MFTLTVELCRFQSESLAEFVGRVGWDALRGYVGDDGTAYDLLDAIEKIRAALAAGGFTVGAPVRPKQRMESKQLTAAIYARVSSEDQNYAMQTTEVRQYAERMGWRVVEYHEKMSAAKNRPVLERLMNDARLRKVDVVLVWKLDRFGRSVSNIVGNILALDQCGVRLVAVTQGIDTDQKSPASRLMIHVLAAVAEFERSMIIDRVRSGMAEAKRAGKHCGRPAKIWLRTEALELRRQGLSLRKIAATIGQSEASVRRALKSASKG